MVWIYTKNITSSTFFLINLIDIRYGRWKKNKHIYGWKTEERRMLCVCLSADKFTEAGKLEDLLAFKVGKNKEHLSPPKKKKRKQVYAQRGRRDCPEKQNKNFLDSSTVVFFWKIISWLSVTPKTTRKTHTKLQHGGHKLTHTYTCNTHWCEMCVRHTWSNYVGSGWWLLVEVEVVGGGGEMGGRVWCTKLTT